MTNLIYFSMKTLPIVNTYATDTLLPLPPILQTVDQKFRHFDLLHLGLRFFDTIGHTVVGEIAGFGVEDRVTGVRIAVARLTHAADVDEEPRTSHQLEIDLRVLVDEHFLLFVKHYDDGNMGVADEADGGVEILEIERRLFERGDVIPHIGLVGRRMNEGHHVARHMQRQR